MEIRDVIPSQSPMPVQKPIEPVHMGFKQVMSRKVQSVQGRENPVEMRRTADAGASRTPASEPTAVEQKQSEAAAGEEIATMEEMPAASDEATASSEKKEIADDASESETIIAVEADAQAVAMAIVPQESRDLEVPDAENDEVIVTDVPSEDPKQATNFLQVKQFLEVHGVPREKGAEMKIEEILSQMAPAEAEAQSESGSSEELQPKAAVPVGLMQTEAAEQSAQNRSDQPVPSAQAFAHPEESAEMAATNVEPKESAQLQKSAEISEEQSPIEIHVKKTSEDRKSPDPILTNSSKSEAVVHHEIMNSKADVPVVRQVVEAIKAQVRVLPGGEGLEISLSPEHLGKVSLKIEIRGGELVANIKVEQQEIKTALEASLQELRESLSQKGVSVKEINVSVSKDEHRGGQEYAQSEKGKDEDEEKQEFSPLFEREIESEL